MRIDVVLLRKVLRREGFRTGDGLTLDQDTLLRLVRASEMKTKVKKT